ncbi:enterobactin synthetase component D [Mesorhizobium robiniae]|uniref:Enterobactin synthase component D n=1 Tax=Mesorhizobium robiniae TaxID=559315 RepID=A0ABV2GZS2_9HYPH|nr:4'-phosphopantetheinyl transferase superfamily protein [Mesorhizobium sp. ZC-5]MCV3244043.1 4'-phosphopantetheinyl transferase superfamily protein [Mesorhizobium sp. ZC-5]
MTLHDTGYVDAVLVHGRFDFESYTEDLFHKLALAVPPSLSKALPLRRAEFLAGRAMAHSALQALSQHTTEIPIGSDRAPVWPKGSVGSITHARGHCACFAKGDPGWQVGVDVEAIASGHALESILSMTANQCERALIARQTAIPPDRLATLLFSAKETLFKGLYPVVRRFFGFDCAELRTTPSDGCLRLHLTQTLCRELPAGESYDIRFNITADRVLTWLAVRRVRSKCA